MLAYLLVHFVILDCELSVRCYLNLCEMYVFPNSICNLLLLWHSKTVPIRGLFFVNLLAFGIQINISLFK
jgi:hypothetical protein